MMLNFVQFLSEPAGESALTLKTLAAACTVRDHGKLSSQPKEVVMRATSGLRAGFN